MREIILFLLGLPVETRETLEEAENYTFTMSHRAPPWSPESHLESKLVTFEGDTVSCARLLANSGLRVAMLNFAHGYNCGGGFEHAGGSQEEAIFRATSVFLSLWPHRRKDDGPGILKRGHWIGDFDEQLPRKEPFYEHTECGGIYSPNVYILDSPDLAQCPCVSVLTVAAQDLQRVKPFSPELLQQKLRTTLRMAAEHGNNAVVLGAFGCGYFGNPPEAVATTFQELLTSEFHGTFHLAVFALLRDRNFATFVKFFPKVTADELTHLARAEPSLAEPSPAKGAEG